jgi:hypothetical protein
MNRLLDKKFASSPFIVKLGTKKKERKKTQIGTNKNNGLIVGLNFIVIVEPELSGKVLAITLV